jgi:hypothetical protein
MHVSGCLACILFFYLFAHNIDTVFGLGREDFNEFSHRAGFCDLRRPVGLQCNAGSPQVAFKFMIT